MKYILGIDIGTTATKSAIFNINGRLIDIESVSYPLFYPERGWVEQSPEDWWYAFIKTVSRLIERNECGEDIIALSLSTQGGSLVILDSDFRPIYPAVSWMDTRAKETADKFLKHISTNQLYRSCGWPIIGGLNLPTIFWFRIKRPDIFNRARYYASTIDYINKLLTGRFAIDHSNLALTEFLNLENMGYNEKAIEIAGLDYKNLPVIVPSGEIVGRIRLEVADEINISRSAVVVSGAHDQYCASIGAGATEIGDCILSAGTAWVLLATADRLYFKKDGIDPGKIMGSINPGIHPINGKYGLMTSVPFGGNALKWYSDIIRDGISYEELNEEAFKVSKCSEGLFYIPIMASRSGRGAFVGIDGIHRIEHFTRAVFEGVAFTNRRHMELIEENGLKVNRLVMIGGGSNSPVWPKIVADVLGRDVFLPKIREASCAGAAVLAGFGAGIFTKIEEGSRLLAGKLDKINPDKNSVENYRNSYKEYIKLADLL